MEAKLRSQGEVSVLSIHGLLNIEDTQFFRESCRQNKVEHKLVFNLENVAFVGSTGIQPFLEALRIVHNQNPFGLRLYGVKTELRRLIQSLELSKLQIYDDESSALRSFQLQNPSYFIKQD